MIFIKFRTESCAIPVTGFEEVSKFRVHELNIAGELRNKSAETVRL